MYGDVGVSGLEARYQRVLHDPDRQLHDLEDLVELSLTLAHSLAADDPERAESVLAAACEVLPENLAAHQARRAVDLAEAWATVAARLGLSSAERRGLSLARRFLGLMAEDTFDERRRVVRRLTTIDLFDARVDDGLEEMVSLAAEALDTDQRAHCSAVFGDLAIAVASVLPGPSILRRLEALVDSVRRQPDALWRESLVASTLASAHLSLSDDDQARVYVRRATVLARRDGRAAAITSWVAAWSHLRSGQVRQAEKLAGDLLVSDGLTMGAELRFEVLALLGECYWLAEDHQAALAALTRAMGGTRVDPRRIARSHEILAELARLGGRLDSAYSHLQKARRLESNFAELSVRAAAMREEVDPPNPGDPRREGVIVLPDVSSSSTSDRVVELERMVESQSAQLSVALQDLAAMSDRTIHDPLTGLANRSRLTELLGDLVGLSVPTSIVVVGLDRFVRVNESLGHAIGDDLLVEVASRLRRVVRPQDTVARWGGDEFVVVMPALAAPGTVGAMAEAILASVAEIWRVNDEVVMPAASIGIAIAPDGIEDAANLLREADTALERAKSLGRNRIEWFGAELAGAARQRFDIERLIRDALDHGWFELYFQPIHPNDDGSPLAAEALLRLNHPDGRVFAPGVFLEVAEDTGLSYPLGVWVIDEACRIAGGWMTAGVPFRFSVNVSASQLDGRLPRIVSDALTLNGVPATAMTLEVTEHLLLEADEVQVAALEAIRESGVRLALDDFGTAYSSLNHLRRFPVDVVKIDRSFIAGICHDPADMAIVAAVVQLSRTFGFAVVAEGVETAEQLDQQRRLGCHAAQGYLIGRPRPAAEFGRMLTSRPLMEMLQGQSIR